jgi:hypothetical protein
VATLRSGVVHFGGSGPTDPVATLGVEVVHFEAARHNAVKL